MSQFATALSLLFSEHFFGDDQWEHFFGLKTRILWGWLEDEDIPTPEHLKKFYETMKGNALIPKEYIEAFEKMAQKPAKDISPWGCRMLPTVMDYMQGKGTSLLAHLLRRMSEKSRAMEEKGRQCFFSHCVHERSETVERWLNDEDIPSVHEICQLVIDVDTLKEDFSRELRDDFYEMVGMNARHVSPHGHKMLPTVADYIRRKLPFHWFTRLHTVLSEKGWNDAQLQELMETMFPDVTLNYYGTK